METDELWAKFLETGSPEDYINYCAAKTAEA